jgi:hypothetical protein
MKPYSYGKNTSSSIGVAMQMVNMQLPLKSRPRPVFLKGKHNNWKANAIICKTVLIAELTSKEIKVRELYFKT